jgi:hypothetical protein
MLDILSIVPGRKKVTQSGWTSFNAVCCHHRGHNPDKRQRGGIKFDENENWTYHCFNCHFKAGFRLGKTIGKNTRLLLEWCGLSQAEIARLNLESLKHRDVIDYTKKKKVKLKVNFKEVELPDGSELISISNPEHQVFVDYLARRGFSPADYPFMITPNDDGRNSNRIIVPYTFKNEVVGHIDRYLDDRFPKYIKNQQQGYVFGIDLQKPNWEVCIVSEGVFDALSINGCALTHDTISNEQAQLLKGLNRTIIVVPDQDKAGLSICEQALDHGFQVSIPNWSEDIKDINDAVLKYGKLPTLLSILQSATNSKIKVEIQRRKVVKRI